ncbi:DUF2079 domain-containing protein [Planctomicrobium sp. SH668]|uniref:DUF2079 domain-containing protein n=1 Tax=Planctomicrobium sp. SH668 TaxID=3448126 RepID=UPI003F5BFAED
MARPSISSNKSVPLAPVAGIGWSLLQTLGLTIFGLFTLENEVVARAFFSIELWGSVLRTLGGSLQAGPNGFQPNVSLEGIGIASVLLVSSYNALCAWKSKTNAGSLFWDQFNQKARINALWTAPIAIWSVLWMFSFLFPETGLSRLLLLTVKITAAMTLAGWGYDFLKEFWSGTRQQFPTDAVDLSRKSSLIIVLTGMAVYTAMFVGMNWGLWFNLQLPHGDSSMYEEHLWNFWHGKGFRSYLDQGLFLGEHIQVIHLILLPFHLLWPSHLMMELAESAVLALGAIPTLWIARRHTGSERAATFAALAYLLYFPMHYLDIAIDLKTFRPSAFGIPALLFMIDAAERRRWGWMTLCVLLGLACQEDFAVAIAPFGVWLLLDGWIRSRASAKERDAYSGQVLAGVILSITMPLYVIIAVKYAIPWFHEGHVVHYASYFQAFGKTPFEIVMNILFNPLLLWTNLVTAASTALLLDLIAPVGFPLRAWRQLLVGVPLFVLLCLNELLQQFPGPFHHFHAALIPTIIWAGCVSLKSSASDEKSIRSDAEKRGLWMLVCAATTSFFFSLSPVGIQFWDAGSPFHWKRLYVPNERAAEFEKVLPLIPVTSRVASTDFVHPRFTHHERSYDYSHYPRRVANYEDKVPDDTEYIVIDTGHRYSEIKSFSDTREFRNQRDQWEVIPVDTKGYFIILKRVKSPELTP